MRCVSTRRSRRAAPLALLLGAAATHAAPPDLLFVRGEGEQAQVHRWPGHGEPALLGAGGPGWLAGPASADGKTALVIAVAADHQRLLMVDVESGVARPIGPPAERLRQPAWSPAGVVVERARGGVPQIWLHPLDGGAARALTAHPSGAFDGRVSPDGRTLTFVAHASGSLELWRAELAGGPPTRLLAAPGDDLQPTWSPDGTRIAFFADRGGRLAVHTIARDGTGERTTHRPAAESGERLVPEQGLAWSPTGDAIALVVRRPDGRPDVRLVDTRRGRVLASATALASAESPAWRPDGSAVVVATRTAGAPGLAQLDRDGTITPLPTGPGWLPRVLPGGR